MTKYDFALLEEEQSHENNEPDYSFTDYLFKVGYIDAILCFVNLFDIMVYTLDLMINFCNHMRQCAYTPINTPLILVIVQSNNKKSAGINVINATNG